MFLLTHAGFRLLWELSSENVSVCTLAHARVCDMTSRNYRAPVDQIYPQILGKPVWISHGLGEYCFFFFSAGATPSFMCVRVSFGGEGLRNYLFGIPGQGSMARPQGSHWKVGWPLTVWPRRLPLLSSSLHPSLLSWFHFSSQALTHLHSSLFIDSLLQTSWRWRLTNALLLRNPRLTLNEATEAKKTRARAGPVLLWKKHEPSWDRRLSLLEWSSFALSKGRLHWKHAAICSLTWRLLWTDLAEELRADKSVSPFKLPSKTPSLKCFCGFHYFLFLTSIY